MDLKPIKLTAQEHFLIGSSYYKEEPFSSNPYVPVGCLGAEKILTLGEAGKTRELYHGFYVENGYLFGLEGKLFVSLEPLDKLGRTVRDPVVLDRETLAELPTKYHSNFLFKRS